MKVRPKTWGLAGAALAIPGMLMVAGTDASARPPGNNGTIKIDGIPFDQHPDNEPHVTCIFEVDFYGYDEGDLNATVTFKAQPPTGKDILLVQDRIFIGEDPAGGGTDVDAQVEFDLSDELALYMAHVNQGYHVKLKVNAPGSIGKDTKYKTFWVTGCAGY